jgi:plasmid stabilization system protein ParE
MDYKVIIAPRAILDLEEIVRYVAQENPVAALRLGFALIEKTKALAHCPELGRVVPEFADPSIRELILKPYRIVYRLDSAQKIIGVARFWHAARGWPELQAAAP